jgi:hypothetical protein
MTRSSFPTAANRITMTGMSWHHVPKDDAWKQAHLAMLRSSLTSSLSGIGSTLLTPLLTISKAMRCTRCGARKGCCWPEPHKTRA